MRVASIVAESHVQRAENLLAMRHQDDRPAAWFQGRIHASGQVGEAGGLGQVAIADAQVRPVLEARDQARQVLRIDVGSYVTGSTRNQRARQIADTGAYLEDPRSYIGPDRVRHPAVEARRAGERVQRFGAFILVDILGEGEPQDYVDRFHRVRKPNLLALFIGAAMVA